MTSKFVKSIFAAVSAGALIVGLSGVAQAAGDTANNSVSVLLSKKVEAPVRGFAGKPTKGVTNTGISYHGGPVMTNGITIYPIWYGTWDASSKTLLNQFMSTIGGSGRFNINTTYYNGSNVKVQNSVALGASAVDNYSLGTTLSDANVQTIVANAIAGGLPKDVNGFYLVLTSADVSESSGFLTRYCGWHTYYTSGASAYKYSFVGNPANGMSSCAAQTTSPNGNAPVDAMISVITHELEEAATDPQLNAWYDVQGRENSDKCAWTWGTTSTASNGSKYNVTIGGYNYLIQQNWVNAGNGGCLITY